MPYLCSIQLIAVSVKYFIVIGLNILFKLTHNDPVTLTYISHWRFFPNVGAILTAAEFMFIIFCKLDIFYLTYYF